MKRFTSEQVAEFERRQLEINFDEYNEKCNESKGFYRIPQNT